MSDALTPIFTAEDFQVTALVLDGNNHGLAALDLAVILVALGSAASYSAQQEEIARLREARAKAELDAAGSYKIANREFSKADYERTIDAISIADSHESGNFIMIHVTDYKVIIAALRLAADPSSRQAGNAGTEPRPMCECPECGRTHWRLAERPPAHSPRSKLFKAESDLRDCQIEIGKLQRQISEMARLQDASRQAGAAEERRAVEEYAESEIAKLREQVEQNNEYQRRTGVFDNSRYGSANSYCERDIGTLNDVLAFLRRRAALTSSPRLPDPAADRQARLEDWLVKQYMGHAFLVAELCDEVLDRSGGLLGRIRDRVRATPPHNQEGA